MSDDALKSAGGSSLPGLLFLTFLVLKLTGVIAWSWWWVTAPLWGPVAAGLVIGLIGGLVTFGAKSRR